MAKKKISNKQKLIALKKANLENAREFVQKNFDAINKGKIDYKSLDTTAKRVFNAKKNLENTFTYKNKFLKNPFNILNQLRAKRPGEKGTIPYGVTDLTNLFPEKILRTLLNTPVTIDFESWKESLGKGRFKKYRQKNGKLLDILNRLKSYQKQGFKIIVKELDIKDPKTGKLIKAGETKIDNEAFVALKNFEQQKQDEFWADRKDELETIEIIYKKIQIDPEDETITIDLNKAKATPKGGTY
ncbi:MAG: hypothetical protein EBR30_14100 [Cytophagia bacterium]|nr:hypothetical protein [Cytophagia bacterium]